MRIRQGSQIEFWREFPDPPRHENRGRLVAVLAHGLDGVIKSLIDIACAATQCPCPGDGFVQFGVLARGDDVADLLRVAFQASDPVADIPVFRFVSLIAVASVRIAAVDDFTGARESQQGRGCPPLSPGLANGCGECLYAGIVN